MLKEQHEPSRAHGQTGRQGTVVPNAWRNIKGAEAPCDLLREATGRNEVPSQGSRPAVNGGEGGAQAGLGRISPLGPERAPARVADWSPHDVLRENDENATAR